ncbi:MAG: glycosyltransferase [Flavobacteriales bacterium]|nr:glycosyltransferase [Flavobacteriales bacterium]
MKLIYITSRFPYPINKGDKLRSFYQIKELSRSNEIYLISLTETNIKNESLIQLRKYCKQIIIHKIGYLAKIFNLTKTFINNKPFQVNYFYHSSIQKKINTNISEIQPDHIFCQLVRTALYIKDNHEVPKTLDYMDALSKGMERRIEISNIWKKPFVKMESKRMKRFENLAYEFFDNHIIISESDRNHISHIENSKINIIPNGIDTIFFSPIITKKTYDLIFVGNLSYLPNVQAAKYISKEIVPLLKRKIPNIKILIAGSNPTRQILKMSNDNIKISGWVHDIRETYCSGKVFFAPLTIGSGLQNKLLEAMSLKIPSVTSPLCNQSLGAKHMKNIIIGNRTEEFVELIVNLLNDDKLATKIGEKGREYVDENFSWESANEDLIKILGD